MTVGTYDDFLDALGQRESSDNYGLVNNGFIGRYQFTEYIVAFGSTVPGLGFYEPDQNRFDNRYDGRWTGVGGIDSLSDFLGSEEAQDALIRAWFDDLVEVFREEDILHYVGQTIDGVTLTLTGLIAGAHLVGWPALEDYLNAPEGAVPRDGFGTPVTEYLRTFAPYDFARPVDIPRGDAVAYTGSSGEDVFLGGGGNDTLDGRGGNDTARYAGPGAAYVIERVGDGTFTVRDLGSGAGEGVDTLRNIERVTFSDQTLDLSSVAFASDGTFVPPVVDERPEVSFDTRWSGTDAGERHAGGATDDSLAGLGGNDRIGGRAGRDFIDGGAGDDTLGGGPGEDTVIGGPGDDRLWGSDGDDVVRGGDGDDRAVGGGDGDTVDGGAGADRLFGQEGNDSLLGGDGDDRLRGGDGEDTLFGGAGNDGLRGGPGRDVLAGGAGEDTLIGGEDGDRFVFEPGSGRDRIHDFEPGEDAIDLTLYSGAADILRVVKVAGAAVVVLGEGDRIRLDGVDVDDVGTSDFLF